jgi:hypothetical protein
MQVVHDTFILPPLISNLILTSFFMERLPGFPWFFVALIICCNDTTAQNVGIGTNAPPDNLTVQAAA